MLLLLYRLVLVVLVAGVARTTAFEGFWGDEDEDDKQKFPALAESKEGKRTPLEARDNKMSPQREMEYRMKSRATDEFTEEMPSGNLGLGDIVLTESQGKRLFKRGYRDAYADDEKLMWPGAVIPYAIDCSLVNIPDATAAIKAAMKDWESNTCIRFVERRNEKKYLRFFRDTGCWGHVGMHEPSSISVGYGCEHKNVMSHEIGHAIGLYHEHNRKDRDQYINVNHNKVAKLRSAFDKVVNAFSHGVAYDYASIMHFPWNALSRDGSRTLIPLRSTGNKKPYTTISQNDIEQVRIMYKCDDVKRNRQDFEQVVRDSTPQRAPPTIRKPRNRDEWAMYDAVHYDDVGEPGCVDWNNNDCPEWAKAGYCRTQDIVRRYCKLSCKDPSVCSSADSCMDIHQGCSKFKRYCNSPNYIAWMKVQCCRTCNNYVEVTCKDTKSSTYCNRESQQCLSSNIFRKSYCCVTCAELKKKRESCTKDNSRKCAQYHRDGYCTSKKRFMERNCCLTCRNAPPPTKAPTKATIGKHCQTRRDCDGLKLRGYCESHKRHMLKNCCLSCGGGPAPTKAPTKAPTGRHCERRRDCRGLKLRGSCENRKNYMDRNCCLTCSEKNNRKVTKCVRDISSNCEQLKRQGKCERDKDRMTKNCCMTCKGTRCKKPANARLVNPLNSEYPKFFGTGKLCNNIQDWDANKCARYAADNWCKTKPKEMRLWCRRTCRFCDKAGLRPDGKCTEPLGLTYGSRYQIPDSAFAGSDQPLVVDSWKAAPENARLYFEDDESSKRIGAWCSKHGKSSSALPEFITVDLGRKRRITHIATQGRDKYFERVSKFKIEYSNTGERNDYCPYLEAGVEKIFEGNCDHVTPVLNQFWTPLEARYIKFIPWGYNYPCVRMEFYGCRIDDEPPVP